METLCAISKKKKKKSFPVAGKWHTRTGRISLSPHLPVGIPAWEICHLKCWYFSQAHSWDICCVCMHEAITFSLIQIYILFSNPYYSFFYCFFPLFDRSIEFSWANTSLSFTSHSISVLPFSWMPDLAVWLLTLSTPSLLVEHLSPIQPHLQTEVMSTVEKTEM